MTTKEERISQARTDAMARLVLVKIVNGANSGEGVTLDAEECNLVFLIMNVLKAGGE